MHLTPIQLAIRTTWPRPRRLTLLEEAAAEAARQLVHARRFRMVSHYRDAA